MAVGPGTRLGPYEISARIGLGGMGEVYRATDTNLKRQVAIKVLPDSLAGAPERLARFQREAEVLASLNHPNIAAIHGLEKTGETIALVMELVDGPTLADRIAQGALPVDKALPIAKQVAEALDFAHECGIIHRDLKPANIKVRPDGTAKILDFGLAKALEPVGFGMSAAAGEARSAAPTITTPAMTQTGVILGTAAYMSPEQARGNVVDKRTDIWAFGCVLYEMLTGRTPFGRETLTDTMAAIVDREPDWSALPTGLPSSIERTLRRCLTKDIRHRARDIGDVRAELDEAAASTPAGGRVVMRAGRLPWFIAVGAALVGIAAGAGLARLLLTAEPTVVPRLSMSFVARPTSSPFGTRNLAISDDGTLIAYSGSDRLWLRRMNQAAAVAIGPRGSNPFFSPSSDTVAIFSEDGGGIMMVPVDGRPSTLLVRTTDRPAGGTWSDEGTIVFATTEGLYRVSTQSGTAELLVAPKRDRGERLYAWPQFLPGDSSVLFTVFSADARIPPQIAMLDLGSRQIRPVMVGGTAARYLPTGHLVFAAGSKLKVVRFEPRSGTVRGDPATVPDVDVATSADNGAANFAVSPAGTFIFTTPDTLATGRGTLAWIDRQGNRERIAVAPGPYIYPRVSPDGKQVALDVNANGNRDIWLLDLNRLSLTQLTDGPTEDMLPEWSVDGRRIFFASDRGGNFDVYSQTADGATPPKVEFAAAGTQTPQAPLPDGTGLIVYDLFKDLNVIRFAKPGTPEPLLHGSADERLGTVSPDGRWLAYESDESGAAFEIFLRPFPNVADGREKVSVAGGRYPHWSRDGKEIFYVNPEGDMMAAAVTTLPVLRVTSVTRLFAWRKPPQGRSGMPYDISPTDGRFLVTEPGEAVRDSATEVSVVLNWTAEVKRLLR